MSHKIDNPETTTYAVAHNGDDIAHLCVVSKDQYMATGQPYLEQYDTKEDLLTVWPDLQTITEP